MKAICIRKEDGSKYESLASKIKGKWLIGGDVPDYTKIHYIIISNDIEYTLKNGRLIKA